MTFTNMMREQDDRGIHHRRLIGFVVNNDDSQHADGKRLQRIQVRLPGLHDDIADADLPWFTPGGLDAYSGGSDVGSHGPIPPKNARVYTRFEDDSQYHGQYLGGVAHVDNQISEFVKPQGSASGSSASTTTGDTGDNESDGDQSTSLNPASGSGYDFTKNYPQPYGGVNASGDFFGHDPKADYTERTLVSGTSFKSDGVGNVSMTISGNAQRSDNADAKAQLPEGFSAAVFGGGTIYISKDCSLAIRGNANIQANGNATVQAKGSVDVISGGAATVNGKSVQINAQSIALNAPSITSQVPIVLGGGGSAKTPADTAEQTAPAPRKRPAAQAPVNEESY